MRCTASDHINAVIRVYDDAGNVIETHEHKGDFKEWWAPWYFRLWAERATLLGKVTIIHDDRELMRVASSRTVRLVLALERSEQMPKYLIQGSYSQQGLKGMLKEGGSKRREAAEQIIKGTGGRLEAYYYAFGSDDFVIIADLPSNVDAAALSLAVNASGAVKSRMTVLITPEEADEATKKMKTVKYRAPGE
jgi:uncharacterized protein with GYD domain